MCLLTCRGKVSIPLGQFPLSLSIPILHSCSRCSSLWHQEWGADKRVPAGEHSTSFPRRVSGKSLPATLVVGRVSFWEMEGRMGTTKTTILKSLSGSEISFTNDSYTRHCSALETFSHFSYEI